MSQTILVVDDDPIQLKRTEQILTDQWHYRTAGSPVECQLVG